VSNESSAPSIETIVDWVGHSSENSVEGDGDSTNRFLSSFDIDQPPPFVITAPKEYEDLNPSTWTATSNGMAPTHFA
jgi:hypothetical protein